MLQGVQAEHVGDRLVGRVDQRIQLSLYRFSHPLGRIVAVDAPRATQHVHDRVIRNAVGVVVGLAFEPVEAVGPLELSVFLDQPALACAGLATHEGGSELAFAKALVRLFEHAQLAGSPDERGPSAAEAMGSNGEIAWTQHAVARAGFGLSLQFGGRQLFEGEVPLGKVSGHVAD